MHKTRIFDQKIDHNFFLGLSASGALLQQYIVIQSILLHAVTIESSAIEANACNHYNGMQYESMQFQFKLPILLLIQSLLSNPDNGIHYMHYKIVKNLASLKGLLWTKYNLICMIMNIIR